MPFAWVGGRTFASLRKHRNFRLYFGSHAVSFIGHWMQQIAAYWLVFELTGSPLAVGALALAQLLPVTFFGLFAGSVIDRFDVRRLLLVTEPLLTLATGTLAVLTLTGAIELWQIYAIATFQGLVLVVDNPARHTLVFRIVGEGRPAERGRAQLGARHDVAHRWAGARRPRRRVRRQRRRVRRELGQLPRRRGSRCSRCAPTSCSRSCPPRARGSARDLRATLSFVRRSRRVGVAFFAVLVLSTVSFNFDVLLPLLAGETLDADADVFGLIAASFGAGALCGALILATVGKASLRLLLGGALGYGVLELALAPQQQLAPVCALLFLTGSFYVLWGSSALATMQLAAPDHLRGRAASLYFFAFQGGAPVGGLLAGWLTARGGTQLAFAVAGTVAVVVAVTGAIVMLTGRPAWDARPSHSFEPEGGR